MRRPGITGSTRQRSFVPGRAKSQSCARPCWRCRRADPGACFWSSRSRAFAVVSMRCCWRRAASSSWSSRSAPPPSTTRTGSRSPTYALDLQDFHAGSRRHPILPILIATEAVASPQALPLGFDHADDVLDADPASLAGLLHDLARRLPLRAARVDISGWEAAPYRPVPNVIDAARILFSRQGVAEILSARSDATNLTLTTECIAGPDVGRAQGTSEAHPVRHRHSRCRQDTLRPQCRLYRPDRDRCCLPDRQSDPGACAA